MDGAWVRRFAREQGAVLLQARVRRVAPARDGLTIALDRGADEVELGLVALPGAAWVWSLPRGARAALHAAIAAVEPELVRAAPELSWRDPDATPLDALRAWLLRPESAAGWSNLENTTLVRCEALGNDRILEFDFAGGDALGDPVTWTLRAELFDRGANALLLRQDGQGSQGRKIVARWRDREPVTPRDPAAAAAEADSASDPAAVAFRALARAAATALAGEVARARRRDVTRLARLFARLQAESANADAASSWRQAGDLLSSNLHRVKRGMERITVEDFFAEGTSRTIELDPKLTPQDNVAAYFKRARRGDRGRATILARLEATRKQLEAITALPTPDPGAWSDALRAGFDVWREAVPRATLATPLPRLWAAGGPERAENRAAKSAPARARGPGRRYRLADGWEVRVGRDDADNDALTHRFAHPDDVWLHASGVAGSHVVLRMHGRDGNPPHTILEIAAALAARFSKAKHAGTVPVIWTRKRYVRKPRGGSPGVAVCTHEKTLFVRPALPETIASDEED